MRSCNARTGTRRPRPRRDYIRVCMCTVYVYLLRNVFELGYRVVGRGDFCGLLKARTKYAYA